MIFLSECRCYISLSCNYFFHHHHHHRYEWISENHEEFLILNFYCFFSMIYYDSHWHLIWHLTGYIIIILYFKLKVKVKIFSPFIYDQFCNFVQVGYFFSMNKFIWIFYHHHHHFFFKIKIRCHRATDIFSFMQCIHMKKFLNFILLWPECR